MSGEKAPSASQFWWRVGLVVLLGVAAFFLLTEHRAHLFGALPYFLLLICLLVLVLLWQLGNAAASSESKPNGEK